ncbi:hypothetical protein [Paraburkholderia tuberum]|uniref:hypothetical protein n=1 Tax=Paraburkholderia tuberum TaxID=157910 RepID=UPI00115FE022|nr:hypothetical protein [Paraburkholderia tuberum]
MQTQQQRDEFQAAPKALTEIKKRRQAAWLAFHRGEINRQQLDAQTAEFIRAHQRCVDAAVPFCGWGSNLETWPWQR